jgi:hypothetical protein
MKCVDPDDIKAFENPAFAAYLRTLGRIEPDTEDLDTTATPSTDAECAREYRLAQGRKIMRIYRDWKARQN